MTQLKFTNEHECVKIEGDIAWVGITKYAQDALGDLVFVELPDIGKKVKKGEYFAVVESVKTAAEVYSPVDGEVIARNDAMPDNLDMIKDSIDGNGWIAKIKFSDVSQLTGLMDEAKYQEYLKGL
jgi:glycine cleavage system H protein